MSIRQRWTISLYCGWNNVVEELCVIPLPYQSVLSNLLEEKQPADAKRELIAIADTMMIEEDIRLHEMIEDMITAMFELDTDDRYSAKDLRRTFQVEMIIDEPRKVVLIASPDDFTDRR